VFDNDGTLWVEQPIYTQLTFIFDRVKQLAPQHPEWKTTQPFKALMECDMKTVMASGEKGLLEMGLATHTGMTAEEFERIVTAWIKTAQHPKLKRLYTECVYQPQLELMAYLRANKFKTFIVSVIDPQSLKRPFLEIELQDLERCLFLLGPEGVEFFFSEISDFSRIQV